MTTYSRRRYRVTVTQTRMAGEDALLPPGAHARAELAAAAVAANDLMTAWTSDRALLSMVIKSTCQADALSAGRAVALAMGGLARHDCRGRSTGVFVSNSVHVKAACGA